MNKKITMISIISFAIIFATALTCFVLSKVTSLEIKVNNLEINNAQLVNENTELDSDTKKLQAQVQSLYNELTATQKTLRETQEQNTLNLQTIQSLNAQIIRLTQELNTYKQQGLITCTFMNGNEVLYIYPTFPGRHIEYYETPEKSGYTFSCWEVNGSPINLETYMPNSDTVLNASFTENPKYVTITKHYLDGTTQTINHVTDYLLWELNDDVADWRDNHGNLYYYNSYLGWYSYQDNKATFDAPFTSHQLPGDMELYQTKDYLFTGTRYINVSNNLISTSGILELTVTRELQSISPGLTSTNYIGSVVFNYNNTTQTISNINLQFRIGNSGGKQFMESETVSITNDLSFYITIYPETYEYYITFDNYGTPEGTYGGVITHTIERESIQHTSLII